MKKFRYTIQDPLGIHARPAGLIVNQAKKYDCKIWIMIDEKRADATRIMALMSLGVKCGQEIQVEIEGTDEEKACSEMLDFFHGTM